MKDDLLKCINVFIDGHRTSVKLTQTQLNIAKELADLHNMRLSDYLVMLIEISKDVDKRYGRSMGVRDGLITELYGMLTNWGNVEETIN